MTSHKHAEMIKAKADNMDLVAFTKLADKWISLCDFPCWDENEEYFLCLPQHKEACLHWLNGGDVDCQDFPINEWVTIQAPTSPDWDLGSVFMDEQFNIRIKPRKEKRWIAVCNSGYNCIDKLFDNKNQAREFVTAFYPNNRVDDFQFIEIEVEI